MKVRRIISKHNIYFLTENCNYNFRNPKERIKRILVIDEVMSSQTYLSNSLKCVNHWIGTNAMNTQGRCYEGLLNKAKLLAI